MSKIVITDFKEKAAYLTPPHAPSLVTTIGPIGNYNIGAFEQTMICSDFPPCMLLAITPSSDTYANIIRNGQFVIAFPTSNIIDQVFTAGEKLSPNESEFELTGLTPVKSTFIAPPRIMECQINFECEMLWEREATDHHIIVGRILLAEVNADLFLPDKVERRLAIDSVYYASTGTFFRKGEILKADKKNLVDAYKQKIKNGIS